MAKIDKGPIEEGIKIAVSAMREKRIVAEITLLRVPDDDEVKKGEFVKIAVFNGNIKFGGLNEEFEFFTPIPIVDYRNEKGWSWVVAYEFLGKALVKILQKEGLSSRVRELHNAELKIVDYLIKA